MPELARRILIDATMARTGGGFTYVANLVPRLCARAPERAIRVLLRSDALAKRVAPAPALEVELLPEVGIGGRLRFTYAELAGIAARWRADVLHVTGEMVPVRSPCPCIASFRNPNVFGRWRGTPVRLGVLRALCALSARASDRVLFVSHDSAAWMGGRAGIPPQRRAVIHHGVDVARFASGAGASPHPRPYVLGLSNLYSYKNFQRLIEAWHRLASRHEGVPDLAIVGRVLEPETGRRLERARDACGPLAARVHFVGGVAYDRVPDWYRHAAAFAFPSLLETFGHPLLEAMAAGTPILASDTPVSREIAGDAAHYADARDPEAISRALEAVLFDTELRRGLVARGAARVARFTWDESARRHLELFDAVAAERRPG